MRIGITTCGFALAIIWPMLLAAQAPNVTGTWLEDSNGSVKWILAQQNDKLHVQEMNGDKVEAEFTCSLNGQECPVKEEGHSEKVMMYFNGERLVEIRERGDSTVKRRLTVSADGKTLKVETVPLSADQRAETVEFRRQSI